MKNTCSSSSCKLGIVDSGVFTARARRDAALTDCTNRVNTGNAFLKEILYSSADASQLLDDTQKALQVAQDIFAEDSKVSRYTCFDRRHLA